MIVSASRRTDIPAFYLDWLMGRLEAGRCAVRSPYDASSTRRVALDPAEVECIVFWTRDPRGLAARAAEIERLGFRFYVHVTLCAYPAAIEPSGLGIEAGIDALRELADAVGPERALWRYDPVFVARGIDADFHRSAFEALASGLEGSTRRVSLSLLDEYAPTASRLERAGFPEVAFGSPRPARRERGPERADGPAGPVPDEPLQGELDLEPAGGASDARDAGAARPAPGSAPGPDARLPPEPYSGLLADLAAMARGRGIEPVACAEPYDLSALGIGRASCVDAALVARLRGEASVDRGRDRGQRPGCGCAPSVDIGAYGTCPAGCAYCYARRGAARRLERGPGDEAL